MSKSRIFKFMAVLAAAAVFFCGCSGDNSDKNVKKDENKNAIALQMRTPSSLNPLEAENLSVADALSLCYEPLFALDDSMEPRGVLARSISVADDCQSAVITLKDSVLWHDGIKLTSADVAHTINFLKENSHLEYSGCVKYIESVQTIDPTSLKIVLSRPYGQIAYSLCFPIVAAHNADIGENIIGTGPYAAVSYSPAVELELESFDKWHGGTAECDRVTISVIRDNETATSAFNTGRINTITSKSFDTQNSSPRENSRTTMYPSVEYEYMAFNHKSAVFSSQAIRAAVSCAIDRSSIVKECYSNAAQEANAPIHPGAQQIAASTVLSQYNLANAGEMLFLEGYFKNEDTGLLQNENGGKLSFTVIVNKENLSRVKTAYLLQSQLFAAGIEVNVKELEFEDYTARISRGEYEAYIGGIRLGNLYDFEALLSGEGKLNNFGYRSEYMNLSLSALSAAPTADSLSDAVANFEEVFLREQPICGLVFRKDILMTAENVMGKLLPTAGCPYANIAGWSVSR